MTCAPTFIVVRQDGSFKSFNFFQMINAALGLQVPKPPSAESGKYASLMHVVNDVLDEGRGPIVLFPEGMKSNGTCILSWTLFSFPNSERDIDKLSRQCAVVTFKYDSSPKTFNPPHTVHGKWQELIFCFVDDWTDVVTCLTVHQYMMRLSAASDR
eukprot:GHVU01190583.1.p3 GENE.GHVU01190583.1~~GHVU01190583.1.p3  ORF type:complete len:156 (-),score=19.86 GHVU01190583.1:1239-1706(-)